MFGYVRIHIQFSVWDGFVSLFGVSKNGPVQIFRPDPTRFNILIFGSVPNQFFGCGYYFQILYTIKN